MDYLDDNYRQFDDEIDDEMMVGFEGDEDWEEASRRKRKREGRKRKRKDRELHARKKPKIGDIRKSSRGIQKYAQTSRGKRWIWVKKTGRKPPTKPIKTWIASDEQVEAYMQTSEFKEKKQSRLLELQSKRRSRPEPKYWRGYAKTLLQQKPQPKPTIKEVKKIAKELAISPKKIVETAKKLDASPEKVAETIEKIAIKENIEPSEVTKKEVIEEVEKDTTKKEETGFWAWLRKLLR